MEVLARRASRKRRRILNKFIWAGVLTVFFTFMGLSAVVLYAYQMEPPSLSVPETTVVYSANGETIGEFHQGEQRYWIPLDHMGDAIVEATLAIEDRRFHDHYGFDPVRITRAVLANVVTGSKAQGASTITQQYARNLFLTHDKTWSRKLHEAFYALRLELHYSKQEILEGYLNTIYYGHGAYGVEAAANLYFQKNADDLTKGEAALLAGIPKGPSLYSPFVDEERALARQQTVLRSMAQAGSLTDDEQLEFEAAIPAFSAGDDMEGKRIAPYYQDAVRQWLTEEHGVDSALLDSGGLSIYTTIDTEMQEIAEQLVADHLADGTELEAAFVAIDPQTGDVKALVGGKNYAESSFNRVTQAKRQPGSTFKPFLYYAALEHGMRPNSMLKSEETTFVFDEGRKEYAPGNFNNRYADDYITMLQALAVSDNIFAMKTHFLLGFDDLVHTAARFGIQSDLDPVPALALGSGEVEALELTAAYSPFANGGFRVAPRFVERIEDRDGNIIFQADADLEPALNPAYAAVMTDMMTGMFDTRLSAKYAPVTGGSVSDITGNRPVAGKSGSTSWDSWMVGYAPQLVAGVWTGYDDSRRLQRQDSQHAKQIWAQFMAQALNGELKLGFKKPGNVVEAVIDPSSGLLATESCPTAVPALFYKGTEPFEYCPEHIEHLQEDPESGGESDGTGDGGNDGSDGGSDPADRENEKKDKLLDRFLDWIS